MIFRIRGNPIAKARPRFVKVGKFAKTYSAQDTEEGRFMLQILEQWQSAGNKELVTDAVMVYLNFYFERPKYQMGTGKNEGKVKPSAPAYHTIKPDVDNLIKFAMDCMTGTVFKDDSQVCYCSGGKGYGNSAETTIELVVVE